MIVWVRKGESELNRFHRHDSMKRFLFLAQWLVLAFLTGGIQEAGAVEPGLDSGVKTTLTAGRSTFNRASRSLVSEVSVQIQNTGSVPLLPPMHVVVTFTAANGGSLGGLTTKGLLGGVGMEPHGAHYADLSALIGPGLAAGAQTSFNFSFERPAALAVTYAVAVHGVRNREPVVMIGGPYSGQAGEAILFDAEGTTDPDEDALSFAWNFGDGETADGISATHSYTLPGLYTVALTVSDGRGAEVFRQAQVRVNPAGDFALARARTLDGSGHPLGGVTITETGPTGTRQLESDEESAIASLGSTEGAHRWRFAAEGHLTVHRSADLAQGRVGVVPYPWMTRLAEPVALPALQDSTLRSPSERVQITLPAGALGPAGQVSLTELHGQSLPLPLPPGWSPLAAFHLQLSAAPLAGLIAQMILPEPVPGDRATVLIRLDETSDVPEWKCLDEVAGSGGTTRLATLNTAGSYALVMADALPGGNPPAVVIGEPLPAGAAPATVAGVTAAGVVNPESAMASREAELVTAQVTVTFTNAGQPLASGAWFLADVEEAYDLLDGRALKTPDYDASFFAYQHPGGGDAATAAACFPLRPRVLFGPDELSEARIVVQVQRADTVAGGVVTGDGGRLTTPGVRIEVPPGAVSGFAAAQVRELPVGNLSRFTGGLTPPLAFDLRLPPLAGGLRLGVEFTDKQTPNTRFVLARCVSRDADSGLQPVLRLQSDAQGRLSVTEPGSGARLPGLTGSGQFVLVPVGGPQALLTGTVKKADMSPQAGALVRVSDQPWLAISGGAGGFNLLSPPGTASVSALHPITLHSGQAEAMLSDAASVAEVEIVIGPRGPRVVVISPEDGGQGVRLVEPVVLTFSVPVLPGTLVAEGALVLRKTADSTAVPGSLIVARGNREARFLPSNPLDPGTSYTLVLAETIEGTLGLPIEGPREFQFTTRVAENRGLGAQLVIFEPDAEGVPQEILDQLVGYDPQAERSMVVAHGSPGTADPQVPVILVNETTGMTSTVLSRVDGSFANFVAADEEDFISAVFVNANGSRVSVPASRQLYDDGRVGLYNGGGILEAESDGGPVQVIVKPGSIEQRSIFSVSNLPLTELLALLGDAKPEGDAEVLAGLRVAATGDAPTEPLKVRYPIAQEDMNLPDGVSPEDVGHVLTAVREVEGRTVFEVLDDVAYRDGHLETNSPPFVGMLASGLQTTVAMLRVGYGKYITVSGRAVSFGAGPNPLGGTPVEGALVFVSGQGLLDENGQLNKGALVSVTRDEGQFALLVPESLREDLGFALLGFHPRMPGAVGRGTAVVPDGPFTGRVTGQVNFQRQDTASSVDHTVPVISMGQAPANARAGQLVVAEVLATDDRTAPGVFFSVLNAFPLGESPQPVFAEDVSVVRQSDTLTSTTRRVVFHVRCPKAASVMVEIRATDGSFNMATSYRTIHFGAEAGPPATAPDPHDKRGPFVLNSWPQAGAPLPLYTPIEIEFNEPVDSRFLAQADRVFLLQPDGGTPVAELSADQTRVTLRYPKLIPGATYNLFVSAGPGNVLRDRAGNPFDQTPGGMLDFFDMRLRVNPLLFDNGLTVENGVAATGDRNLVFILDRRNGNVPGRVMVWGRDSTGRAISKSSLETGVYPRDLIWIKGYNYPKPLGGPAWNRDLLVVVGGKVGTPGVEGEAGGGVPWLRVFDVTDPATPLTLASTDIPSSLTRVLAKLDWSPPMLGVLEIGPDGGGVNLVNFPLLIWNHLLGSNRGNEPPGGHPGLDANGDGDYADDGDLPPRLNGLLPTFGWINGGWVGRAELLPSDLRNIEDAGLLQGGSQVAAVVRAAAGKPNAYKTLRAAGQPVPEGQGELALGAVPRRLLMLTGVPLQTGSGLALRNLALVTFSGRPVIQVLDITEPLAPVSLGEVTLPLDSGDSLHTMVVGEEGRVIVASGRDLHVLDPSLLLQPATLSGAVPAVLGIIPGAGVSGRRFAADGAGFFGIASGGKVRVATDNPVNTQVSVNDIELRSERVVANTELQGERLQVRRSSGGLLEIASDVSHEVLGTAIVIPGGTTVPESFPGWTLVTSAGGATRRGKNVSFDSPAYNETAIQAVNQLAGHSNNAVKLGAFLMLALLPGENHIQRCESASAILRVYPSKEVKGDFTSDELKARDNKAAEGVVKFLQKYTPAGVEFDAEISGKLKYSGGWQECPNSQRVIFGVDLACDFDPLLAGEVKVPLTAPQLAWLSRLTGATSYMKMKLGIGLAGFGRRNANDGLCGSFSGPGMRASGMASATVGFEINSRLVKADVSASGGFTISGYMTPAVPEQAFTVRDFKLESSGITATAKLETLAGRIFKKGLEKSFELVEPQTLFQFDWEFYEP
jgi:hypothetical protein